MSDTRRRDEGMTLPELLVCIVVVGLIVTAISAAITVTLRVEPSVSGRLNVARAEQNIATWMPGDLSSATTSNDDPAASPCFGCGSISGLGGSNALMLSWPSGGGDTYVSYVYRPADDGVTYELVRAECTGTSCETITVLRDLDGPPHAEFVAGVTPVPSTVFNVSVPLQAAADEENEANQAAATDTAHRIVVSVNGGGTSDGAGGGVNRISITAGGTTLGTLEPAKVTGPAFLAARSRCGGPITLIVDESASLRPVNQYGNVIADYSANVRTAVSDFVNALAGTPTSVQVVRFDSFADVMSPDPNAWNHYFEMSDEAQVAELRSYVSGIRGDWADHTGDNRRGGTNWEDALFRTFYSAAGQPLNDDGDPTTLLPNLVVLFTDGAPTLDRLGGSFYRNGVTTLPAQPADPGSAWPDSTGRQFSQVAWNRAEFIASKFRSVVRLVGVGVGGIGSRSFSFTDPGSGIQYDRDSYYGWVWQRSRSGGWSRIGFGRDPDNTSYSSTSTFRSGLVGNAKLLGNLVVGGVPTAAGDDDWVESQLVGGEWTNAEDADLLVSPSWSELPRALASIALGQCGGSLTIQTEYPNGSPAEANFTYETGGETVTTSRIARAAAFDLDIPDGGTVDATVTPQSFDPAYTATGWGCSKRGVAMTSGWSLVTPGTPEDGITVTVGANEAVSCTMTVTK